MRDVGDRRADVVALLNKIDAWLTKYDFLGQRKSEIHEDRILVSEHTFKVNGAQLTRYCFIYDGEILATRATEDDALDEVDRFRENSLEYLVSVKKKLAKPMLQNSIVGELSGS